MFASSIVKCQKDGDTSLDPVSSWYPRGHSHEEDEIGRVTSRHQDTLSLRSLIDRAVVEVTLHKVLRLAWFEPNRWALHVENLGVTFIQDVLVVVPFTSFHVHSYDVCTVLGCFFQ